MANNGNLGNVLNPPTPPPYNYRDPNYAKWVEEQKAKPPPAPPDLTNGGQNTELVDASRRNPPPGAGPGHWLGNQWILDEINYPPTGTVGSGHYENGVWISDPVTDETGTAPPPTTTPPPTSNTSSGGGGGGSAPGAPPSTTVSSVYNDIIAQLLGASSSGGGAPSSFTAPTRQNLSLNLPPPSQYNELVNAEIRRLLGGKSVEEVGKEAGNSLPVSAFRNSMLRELGVNQAGLAEQSGINGTQGSGGMAGRSEALRQAAGESTADFTGKYVDKAMADRRAELQRALEMAQKQGNFEDSQALAAEIARLDAQEKQYQNEIALYNAQITNEADRERNANQRYANEINRLLGLSDLELRRELGIGRLDLDWFLGLSSDDRARQELALTGGK